MADNVTLNLGSGGPKLATSELAWSGDTAHIQILSGGFLTGSAGSWVYTSAVAGAGVVGSGVQRFTLASDDPAVTALQIIDDWDESDRAKVNLIVGQAGIAAGAGAVGVTVPRVTLASNDPAVALLTTIDADTDAIKTAIEMLDNVVHVEDAAHVSGDSGAFVLAVRNDTLAALATTDGDYAPLQVNATGALYVSVSGTVTVGSHAVTNAGTFAVQVDGNALTALQLLDDIVHSEDAAHSGGDAGAMLLAVRNDTPGALATTDGDYIPLTTDSTGRLYTSATQSGTWNIGTVTAVTAITNALPAGDNNIGNVDIVTLPSSNLGAQAMAASLCTTIATDDTHFGAVGAAADVDGVIHGQLRFIGETLTTLDGKVTACNTGAVAGVAAENAAASGNPVLVGGRYDSTARTLGNGDVGAPAISPTGEMIMIPQTKYVMDGATRCEVKHINTTTSTSDTSLITAVASKRFRILSIKIIGLSTTATSFHLETKTTNTDCWGDSTNPIPVAVDADGDNHGGIVLNWNPGGWFETADANEDLAIILSAAQPVTILGNYIEVD